MKALLIGDHTKDNVSFGSKESGGKTNVNGEQKGSGRQKEVKCKFSL
jgi:hypothetical protein